MTSDHKLVVVGGGVAGLDIAGHLAGRAVGTRRLAVTLIDREPAHVWKPMLHTIAAGTQEAATQQTPYLVQAHDRGFIYQPGEAVGIDRQTRSVHLAPLRSGDEEIVPARSIAYDTLVLAVGSEANDFGTPGVAEHCFTINTRSQAISFNDRMRADMLKAFAAERTFSVAIVGGGATGVELAAEIVQLVEIVEHYGVARSRERLRVTLIESGDRLLRAFPERVARAAEDRLRRMGVIVRTGVRVHEADAQAFHLPDGETIQADLKVWAAGVRAPDIIRSINGLRQNKAGQILVGPNLVAIDDARIVAVGDCASPQLAQDAPVPTTAQAAFQEAAYLIRHLPAILNGGKIPDFRYRDFGGLVSLGGYDAYGTLGQFGLFGGGFLRGRVAQLGHALLYRRHQARLHGLARGSLLWLADILSSRVRPPTRLS